MQIFDEIKLLTIQKVKDEDGYEEDVTTERPVFAEIKSVRRNEFFLALQAGIEESIVFDMWNHEYSGERYLLHNDKKYKVIRAYSKDGERIELSCSEVKKNES